jgi:16S rRNA A1518/A1519 N6-dimethyltransferase RsmA/KsgA/DIM1 with predicted DNA glycosylase/AP lyase activity
MDSSVIEIAKGCSQLTSINLELCKQITDASVIEIAKRCSQLTSINLQYCHNITDASLNKLKNIINPYVGY